MIFCLALDIGITSNHIRRHDGIVIATAAAAAAVPVAPLAPVAVAAVVMIIARNMVTWVRHRYWRRRLLRLRLRQHHLIHVCRQ